MTEKDPFARKGKVARTPPNTPDIETNPDFDLPKEDSSSTQTTMTFQNTKRKGSPIQKCDNKQLRIDLGDEQDEPHESEKAYIQEEETLLNRAIYNLEQVSFILEKCARSKRTLKDSDIAGFREAVQSLRADFLTIHEEAQTSKAKLAERAEILDTFKEICCDKQPCPKSYAHVASRVFTQTHAPSTKSTTKTMLLYPTKENSTSEELKDELMKSVHPRKDRIRICRMSRIRNGGIALELETEAEANIVKNRVANFAKVQEPKKRLPKLIIYNVPNEYKEQEVIHDLVSQNLNSEAEDIENLKNQIKICFKTGPKELPTHNLVIELPPKQHKVLRMQGRAYLGWNSTKVADFVSVTRCYKCQKFGHIAKECNSKDEICGHCSKTGHDRRNCPLTRIDPICANCPTNKNHHDVHSKTCPAFLKEKEKVKQNTQYD